MKRFLPVALFAALLLLLAVGLRLNPRELPSTLIDRPAPAFTLPLLDAPERTLSPQEMRGQVWLLNVWASWCTTCRQEHALLLKLARSGRVPIVGLNYKDKPEDAQRWLRQLGDPYRASVSDLQGLTGIDYGVYGVPETYVIDRKGMVRYKLVGALTKEQLEQKILPLLKELDA
jgi:cytochrome c biogenesis protein CcmG/thiol:disulfide interchange protein DsbE